jgi:Fe-S oxidoreductase
MGWLPVAAAAVAATAPRLVNTLAHAPGLARLAKKAAGVDPRREIPVFAAQTFQQWFAHRTPAGGERGEVVLWPDTFTNHFHPGIARAAVEVVEDAGWRVVVPEQNVCCGLTWISTGQLGTAKRVLRRSVDVLRPHLRAGRLVLGLEPSCTAVFRSDAGELFPHDQDVRRLRRQTVTLAELLTAHTPGWRPPRVPRTAHVQTHCHQHAILGTAADEKVLCGAGVQLDALDSGCCGLAGNFGFEEGHYEVSEACAERVLLPAVRDAGPADVILADGFSCRTQVQQSDAGGRRAVHLAELLRAGLHGDDGQGTPEQRWTDRPAEPSRPARVLSTAAAAGLVAAGIGYGVRRLR